MRTYNVFYYLNRYHFLITNNAENDIEKFWLVLRI